MKRLRPYTPNVSLAKPRALSVSLARFSSAMAVCAALFAGAGAAKAAVLKWDPGVGNAGTLGVTPGGSGLWINDGVTTNWFDNSLTPPSANTAWINASDAIFDTTGGTVTVDTTSGAANAITLGNITISASGYSFQGATAADALTLGATSITANNDVTMSVILAGNSLNKLGAGALTLSGANTHTGGTTLTTGTLNINNATALGAAAGAFTIAGGTIDNTSAAAITLTNNNAQNWNGNFTFTGTKDLNLGTGAVALNAARQVTVSGGTLTVGGAISGATFGITKAGPGALTLNGVIGTTTGGIAVTGGLLTLTNNGNTFTGGITVDGAGSILAFTGQNGTAGDPNSLGTGSKTVTITNGGTIRPTSSSNPTSSSTKGFVVGTGGGTFNVATGVTLTLDDATQFSGSGDLTVTGAGTGTVAIRTQAFNTFTGNVNVNSGTLQINNTNSLGNTAGKTVTVASGGVFDIQAANLPQNIVLNGTGISSGGALINSSATAASTAATATFALASNSSIGGAGAGGITVNNPITGAGFSLTKFGAGTVILSNAASSYSGGTIVSGGTLRAGVAGAIPVNALTVNGGGTMDFATNNLSYSPNALTFGGIAGTAALTTGTGTLTLPGNTTYDATNNPGVATISGLVSLGASDRTFTVGDSSTVAVAAGELTISAVVSGSAGIIKTGSGNLALISGSANTFTGGTPASAILINQGGVLFTADNQLGNAANGITINGGTLSESGASAPTLGAGRVITIGASGGAIDVQGTPTTGKIFLGTAGQLTGAGTLTKTGPGDLQLGAANTGFTGAVTANGGVIELQNAQALGTTPPLITLNGGEVAVTNATWTGNLTAGVGGGTISGNSGNSIYSGTITASNPFSFGLRDFNNTATGRTLTVSGTLTGSGNATLVGPTAGSGTLLLTGNTSGYTGTFIVGPFANLQVGGSSQLANSNAITLNGGTTTFVADGNGLASGIVLPITPGFTTANPEVAATFTDGLTLAASSTIAVGKNVAAQALNKSIVESGGLTTNGAFTLTVTPSNGYGLNLTGITTITTAAPTFSVGTATASNVVQGLTLSNQVTGSFGFTKAGAGTIVLGSASNNFTGNVNVTQGVVSIASDTGVGASNTLGAAANEVVLTPGGGFTSTLRATDDITTARQIKFGNTTDTRAIEVVGGKTLTLTSAFDLATTSSASLTKNDNGTLAIGTVATPLSNAGWTGATVVNAGAVLINHATALGSGTITVANLGSALQLSGGITIVNPITLNANSNQLGGINSGGALQSVSGVNIYNGTLTQTSATAATLGADAGATLNFTGTYLSPGTNSLGFQGAGTINWQVPMHNNGQLFKFGTGTFNLTAASPAYITALTVNGGTFALSGAGTFGSAAIADTVTSGATLKVDDTGAAPVNNRLGALRTMNLSSGTFQYVANANAASVETIGALTSTWGGNNIQVDTTGQNSTLTFASLASNVVSGGSTLTFKAGGTGLAFGGATNTVLFTTAPTLSAPSIGIIPRAIVIDVNGTNFATYNNTGLAANTLGIQALTNSNIPIISSTTVAGTTVTVADTSVLTAGMAVYGPNVPAGSTITSILSPTTYQLSATATAGTPNLAYGTTADTNINSFLSLRSAGENIKLGTGFVTNGNAINSAFRTFGSVNLAGGATLDSGAAGSSTYTVTSGNILSTGASTNTIGSGAILAAGATEIGLNVAVGNTLVVNGTLTNAANVTKGLDGNLTFGAKQYFNPGAAYFTINGAGTVTLASGINHTLFPGVQGGTIGSYLAVGPGATLDLNGTAQLVGELRSPNNNAFVNSGGTVTSSAAATLVDAGGVASNWGGQIAGNVFFAKGGNTAFNAYNDNTFSGGLLLMGNTTTLIDSGKFSGLTAGTPININGAALTISNAGTLNSFDRIPDAVPINFRAGSMTFTGRAQTASSETLGTLTLVQGASEITVAAGATGVNSADLVFASINTASNPDATLNIHTYGLIGSNPRILVTTPLTVTNNIVTPQIESGGADFASYTPSLGLTTLGATGAPAYDGTTLPASNQATQNIKLAANGAVPNGGLVLNTLNATAASVTFTTGTDTLNLAAGGLMHTGVSSSIGGTVDSGRVTAGGASPTGTVPLYLYNVANTFTINSRLVDPTVTNPLRLVVTSFNGGNISLTNGSNSYTGGTVMNGWIGNNAGVLQLNGAAGQVVIPAGGLTLTNGLVTEVTNGGQINPTNVVTLNGASVLTLVGANTLNSLVFNNNGGVANPSVASGGVLSLSNSTPISVLTPSNPSTVATVSGTLDFANGSKTIFVDPTTATVGGPVIAPLTAGLNISALIQNAGQIIKTGAGNLQLTSTTSNFTGGVNLSQGGLIISGNSSPSAFGIPVFSGPLGTGTLTIGTNTTLLAAAASTVSNPVTVSGSFTFDGITNLTLNGNATLPASVNTDLTVNAPQMTATLGGNVSGSGSSITKKGLGILALASSASTFTGGVKLNSGTLLATGASPFGTGTILLSGGLLQLKNNSGANFGNGITLDPALTNAFIDINNNGANTGNTFVFGTLTSQPTTTLNVTGGNGYKLQFSGTNLTAAGSPANFNPASGLTIILPGGFNNANRPVNIGQGLLAFSGTNTFTGDTTITGTQVTAPQANAVSAPYGSGNVILGNGSTLQITPTINTLSQTGYTAGGLAGRYFSTANAPFLNAILGSGFGAAAVIGGVPSSDANISNHPAALMNASGPQPTQDIEQYVGSLNITNAGTYNFQLAKDDEAVIFVDGVRVAGQGDLGNVGGGGWNGFAGGAAALSAGLHSFVVMHQNGGGGSGVQVMYNGPDTAGQPGAGWQAINASNLYYNTAGLATAGNGYLNAAQLNNNVNLLTATSATLDGVSAQYNSTVATLNLGNSSTLTVNNAEGTGFIGSIAAAQVGSGVTINTNSGMLYLIGGVNDSPSGALATAVTATGTSNGLTKTGTASLILGGSTSFTGPLTINNGTVVVADPAALPTSGTGITTVGNTSTTTFAAAGNTIPTGTAATAFTITVASTAGLIPGQGFTGTGIGANAYVVSITDATHFVAISPGASTASTGTSALTFFSGATLDLNGISNVAGTIVLNGNGSPVALPVTGALYNSSATAASVSGSVAIGGAINARNPAIGGYGDITISGAVSDNVAGQVWSKVGPNILTLSGNNTFTGALTVSGGILKLGSVNSLGTSITNGVTLSGGTALDLGGSALTVAKTLTITGTGITGLAVPNTLASLINSSGTLAASYAGPVAMAAASSVGSAGFFATNTPPAAITASPVPAAGDVTLSGVVSGAFVLTKVGSNTLFLTNAETFTGGAVVSLGQLVLGGTNGSIATTGTPLNTIATGGTITLDNTSANFNSRLGGHGTTVNGNLTILGSSAAQTQELISVATNNLTFTNSGSVVTLIPGSGQSALLNITSNTALARSAGATSLWRGPGLGTQAFASLTAGNVGFADGTQAAPGFSGTQTLTTNVTNRGVLAWALVDTTSNGTGASFATYNATNGFQALNFATDGVSNALTASTNVLSTTGVTTAANGINAINSLTLNGGAATVSAGSTLQLLSGGILNLSGTAATPNTISGAGALSTNANVELIIHSPGTTALNITSQIAGTTGGITKADGGTVILGAKALHLGATTVNGGTLQLNGGSQTIFTAPNAGQSPGTSGFSSNNQVLQVNLGGTLDLNGTNQMVANLTSAGTLPNTGGTVTNTSGTASTFQIVENANQAFAGSINGNLNFVRAAGFTYTLESPSNFTGTTTIQGGQTIFQDLAAFTGTSAINLNGGALTWTDTGTQAVANRLPASAPVTFNTGAFTYNARNGVQGAIAIGNATLNSGSSLVTVTPNNGGANLTIGTGTGNSLTHSAGGTVTFVSGGTLGGIGDNAHVYLANQASGIIGGWATAYQIDTAVGQLVHPGFAVNTGNGTAAGNGIVTLNPNLILIGTGNVPTGVNARANASFNVPSGGVTLNTLSIINAAVTATFLNATDTLTLTTGGLLTGADANNKTIGASAGQGQLTAGSGQPELFLHSGANALTINSRIIDNGVSGGLSVVADPMAGAGTLVLAAPNTYLGTTYLNNINTTLNATGGPAIPGNLVITGGVSAVDSLNATTTFSQSNQIATTSTVTLKGGATLSLAGFNNTIANLVLDNTSGDLNGVGATLNTASGTLTVTGTISETNNTDSFTVPQLNGFVNLTSTTPTISIAANPINAAEVGLNLAAAITLTAPGTTPLLLNGGGVIGLSGQSTFSNGISVASGTTLAFGQTAATTGAAATFPSVINSQVNLPSGAILDTRGNSGVIGSLTGTGTVTNTIAATNTSGTLTGAGTLTTGADNVAGATAFDGTLTNPFVQALLNVTKIGQGILVLNADNSGASLNSPNLGTMTVSGGGVTLNSTSARIGFTTAIINSGGTLTLDNGANPLSNRLGGQFLLVSPSVATASTTPRSLTMQGGTLNVLGNNGTAITEGIGQLNPANGGIINLSSANLSGVTLSVFNVSAQGSQSSLRINADNLGLAASGTAGGSNVIVSGTYAIPGTPGAGAAGTALLPVRPDIIATDTVSGVSSFVFKDTNGLRLLNPANEYLTTTSTLAANAAIATANAFNLGLSSTSANQGIVTNTPVGSLTLLSGGGLVNGLGSTGGNFGGAGLETLTLGTAGVLAVSGNTGINVGAITSAGITMDLHVVGAATTLNLNGSITATTQGIVKADDGTLSFNAAQYFTGVNGTNGLTINGGKVVLNAGANTVLVTPTAGVPTVQSLFVNTGTLDLNGNSQAFERIASVNTAPGQTNNIITSTAAANLISVVASGQNSTYAGSIGGALSFYKEGFGNPSGGTMTLTSTNGYTGSTNILGGTLALRDSGALTATSAVNINYAQLTLDNTGLSDSTSRISSTVPVNLTGGTLFVAAGQKVESQSLGTVTLAQGLNQISTAQYGNLAQTGSYTLNVGNLVQSNSAAINFPNNTGVTLGQTAGNPHIFLAKLNGNNFAAANLTNGIIGGWAISNGADFSSYTDAAGVVALGGVNGSPAYSGTALGAGVLTDNINTTATVQSVTGRTINSLAVRAPAAGTTIGLFDASQVLNIATGGLLINTAQTVAIQGGQLTAGGAAATPASLYIWNNGAGAQTINSQIVNNAASGAVVSLVRSGGGTITLTPQIVDTVATITAATATFNVNNTAGLFVGMAVSGTGIPASEFITGISGNTITITTGTGVAAGTNIQTTFAPPASPATSGTTINSTTVTTAANAFAGGATFVPVVGMAIGGPNIPGGTTIASFTGTNAAGFTFTLSQPAIATSAAAVVTVGALSNTYTGATVTNGGSSIFGALNISGLPGSVVIPGDLTVGNTTATVTVQGGIASTSNATVNSGGTLAFTAAGTNTLNSVTFNSNGSSGGQANIQTGTLLNISAANAITATNLDLGHTPIIAGTALALTNAIPAINTSGLSPDDLIISAPITSAGGQIQKTGTGSLVLSGASTFAQGFNVQQGSIIFGANSTGTPPTITNSPAGTGTLTLSGGTAGSTILSSANFTIGNAVSVTGGGFTFGGNVAANGLTLSGIVTLGTGANSINVSAPTVTSTISGQLTGGTNFSKTGAGILTLSGTTNNYGGLTTVSNGVLKAGVASALTTTLPNGSATGAIPLLSQVVVAPGGEFDINGVAVNLASLAGDTATTGGLVTDSGAAATLTIGYDNLSPTFAGIITNAANALTLTKTGTGNQTLSGQNLFTGPVNINLGQLTITNSSGLGVGTKVVTILSNSGYGNGSLHLNPGAGPAIVLPSTISFSTSQTAGPGAVVNDSGNNTINGSFTLTAGGGATGLGSTAGLLTFNGTFTPNTTARSLFFRGNGGFAVTATNAFVDSAANQLAVIKEYGTGTLTISGASANGLIAASTLTVNNGTVLFNGAGKAVFTTDTVQGGATLALDNNGTLTNSRLSGKALTLNGGVVTLNGNSGGAATEIVSSLTLGSGGSTISVTGAGGLGTTLTATALAAPVVGSSTLLRGDNLGTAAGAGNATVLAPTFNVQAGQTVVGAAADANGLATKAIRADIIGDNSVAGTGTGFVTKDSASGNLRPLTTAELAVLSGSTATTNVGNFGVTQTYNTSQSANSLTLNTTSGITSTGAGQALQGSIAQGFTSAAALNTLTLTTGGVLATAAATLNGGQLTTLSNASYVFHAAGAAVLDVNAYLAGTTGGLTKADGGTLKLDLPTYQTGATTVNGGTLLLNSGAANTLVVTPTATVPTVQNLVVNGGTLDLNGQSQAVGSLSNNDPNPNTGGLITSTGGNLISSTGTSTVFAGVIGGGLSFSKAGTSQLTLASANSYTGTTNIQGGSLVLLDSGTLASTTLNVNSALLTLNNQGIIVNTARIPTSANVNLNSGTLNFNGAGNIFDSTAVATTGGSAVALNQGSNAINANTLTATPTPGAAVLTIGNLTRAAGSAVTFSGVNLGLTGAVNNFGLGVTDIVLSNVNGSAVSLNNGIIGGWATVAPNLVNGTTVAASATITLNGETTANLAVGMPVSGAGIPAGEFVASITSSTTFTITTGTGVTANGPVNITVGTTDFAGYSATTGVGGLNTTGFATYDSTDLTTAVAVNNVRIAATPSGSIASKTINSLNVSNPAAATAVSITAANTLTIGTGGLIFSDTQGRGISITGGALTAGTSAAAAELFAYVNTSASAQSIGSQITDNASAGSVSLVKNGAGNLSLAPTVNNTYTGATFVNQGTVTLGAGAGITVVPGNLTITGGATVTETANAGQIAIGSNVTINGSGALTLPAAANTLASLTFNNNGGTTTPTVTTGTSLILSAASAITASNDNLATTPTITGTALNLSNASPVINVTAGLSADGLIISAPLDTTGGGTIAKTGGGSLIFSGATANPLTGGLNINQGTVIFDSTAASNAYGTGTIALADTTTIMAGTAARTISNPISVAGSFTFGGTGVTANANNLTLSNTVTLAAGAHGIAVSSPLVTDTISGKLTGGTNFTKAGPGTLLLSGATNDYGGTTTVAGGVLKLGNAAAIPSGSGLQINPGAVLDVAGFASSVGSLSGDTATSGGMVTNSGALTTLTIGNDNTSPTFAGILTNAANALGLTKQGTGTQTLAGANSYTGPTNVTAGSLLINGLQGAATGAVTVSSGATLGGTGTIGGPTTIQNGGNLKPGTSAGLLTFASNLTLGGNATNSTFEIQGTARGTVGGYDAINLGASSILTYAGILTLDISSTLPNGTYDLFSFTSAPTGNFFNVTLTGSGGYSGDLTNSSGVWTADSKGQTFTFTQATGDLLVVPEPSALVSLLGGLGVLLGFRRARRRA
ncbi:MAG: hypothetical protein QOE70_5119 [Chthoniobacter sp.]|jgi:autotransporter-associated beta strand protein|nr:hypothetical protein [Chthoniobacter sp.]